MPRTDPRQTETVADPKTSLTTQYRAIGPAAIAAALLCAAKKVAPASTVHKAA